MNRLKSLIIGAGVALFNLSASFIQVLRPERCTGACGSCGLSCVEPLVGLVGIGIIAVTWRKLKGKFKRLKFN